MTLLCGLRPHRYAFPGSGGGGLASLVLISCLGGAWAGFGGIYKRIGLL